MPRERLIETAKTVYRSFGFSPIDTPVLEYLEVLRGKGGEESDRLMYHFADHGGRDVGMRFDLTVPFARFAAQHIGQLGTPFKRYHIAKVWRGENTHKGRYREFMQCDFDTIGTESTYSDIETVLVIHDLMLAIGMQNFQIRMNNRQVLSGLLQKVGLADNAVHVLRALDKLPKIGKQKVIDEMTTVANATSEQATTILEMAELDLANEAVVSKLQPLVNGNELGEAGVQRLHEVIAGVSAAGVPADRIKIDPSIARGLDYYTGTIVETFLTDLPGIGSVCSGGRYDDLAGLYTKQKLPGIGASLGLDRLLAAMEELGLSEAVSTPAPVLVAFFDKDRLHDYLSIAAMIRAGGIGTELFPEPKKLGQQLKYADRKGFRIAIIAGQQEFDNQTCQVKNLQTGESAEVKLTPEALVGTIRDILDVTR